MKLLATLFSCLLLCHLSAKTFGQFTVTKVNGRIKTESGTVIRPGTELRSNDRLVFSSTRDKLWVIQAGKGERMISPTPQATQGNSVFTQLLITALHMDSRSGSLSGRGAMIEKLPDALQANSGTQHKILIEDRNRYLFDPSNFPQTGGATFFLQIDMPGEPSIIRRLTTNNDTLILLYSDFYTESYNSSIVYKLGYYNPGASPSTISITSFDPFLDQSKEMESVIATTIIAYNKESLPRDSIFNRAYNNIYFTLGKPDYFLFSDLFTKFYDNPIQDEQDMSNKLLGASLNKTGFESVPILSASASVSRDQLPSNFSLRQYAPPIGNQEQYGSCTAWATAYATRTISYAIHHNYSIHNHYDKIISYTFAPDFIYNNIRSTSDCNTGTAIYDALQFMKDKGNLIRADPKFVCGQTYSQNILENARNYLIKDFSGVNTLRSSNQKIISKIKGLLVSRNALPFSMHVPYSFKHVGPSGIWYPTGAEFTHADSVKRELAPFNGHAMCLIGYNDSIAGGSFEVMNSWGPRNGNNGFYWVNYDDFLAFYAEVYTINDFEVAFDDNVVQKVDPPVVVKPKVDPPVIVKPKVDPAVIVKPKVDPPVIVKPKVDPPVIVKPKVDPPVIVKKDIVIVPKKDSQNVIIPIRFKYIPPKKDSQNIVIVPKIPEKPTLKGNLEFQVQNPDGSHETIAVNKKVVGGRGQDVSDDATDQGEFANFELAKPFTSGTRYRIKFNTMQPAYIYVFGMDNLRIYNLFPQKKYNESALINLTNATLSLPNDSSHYKLDNVPGKERMCVLLSKSPINIDLLNQHFSANGHNLYQAVRTDLAKRLIEMTSSNFSSNKIEFESKVNDDSVMAFFIEINHL